MKYNVHYVGVVETKVKLNVISSVEDLLFVKGLPLYETYRLQLSKRDLVSGLRVTR
jgi:hypothetical protein